MHKLLVVVLLLYALIHSAVLTCVSRAHFCRSREYACPPRYGRKVLRHDARNRTQHTKQTIIISARRPACRLDGTEAQLWAHNEHMCYELHSNAVRLRRHRAFLPHMSVQIAGAVQVLLSAHGESGGGRFATGC